MEGSKKERKSKTYLQLVRHDNFIVRDHHVHGIHTLPGVTLLDLVYRLVFNFLNTKEVTLKNILFKQPIVTSESFDVKVFVKFIPMDTYWRIKVFSQKVQGGQVIEQEQEENMECLLLEGLSPQEDSIDIEKFIAQSQKKLDMDELYKSARDVGINHYVFMKTLGTVYQNQDEELIELHLSSLAEEYRNMFYAHPAFLDGATFSGGSFRIEGEQRKIFSNTTYIPFMVKQFCIYRNFPKTVYVYSKKMELKLGEHGEVPDIFSHTITIFDRGGSVLAKMEDMTAKCVRNEKLIKNLVQKKEEIIVQKEQQAEQEEISTPEEVDSISEYLKKMLQTKFEVTVTQSNFNDGFYDLGLNSIQLLQIVNLLEEKVNAPLYPTLLFEYSNITSLAEYLEENYGEHFVFSMRETKQDNEVEDKQTEKVSSQEEYDTFLFVPKWEEEKCGTQIVNRNCHHIVMLPQSSMALYHFLETELDAEIIGIPESDQMEQPFQTVIEVLKRQMRSKQKTFLQLVVEEQGTSRFCTCLSSLLKTAHIESHYIDGQIIITSSLQQFTADELLHMLRNEYNSVSEYGVTEIKYGKHLNERYVKKQCEIEKGIVNGDYQNDDVYIITGGLGGLGLMTAKHIAKKASVNLILVSRSKPFAKQLEAIKEIETLGSRVETEALDISNEGSVKELFDRIIKQYGKVTGIIHAAGIVQDSLILKKDATNTGKVFAPKINGIQNICNAVKELDFKFLVVYSSVSAIVGNTGQADYATANCFMGIYLEEFQNVRKKNGQSGEVISINWPLWENGGMQIDKAGVERIEKKHGMKPLESQCGMETLDQILAMKENQVTVFYGQNGRVQSFVQEKTPMSSVHVKEIHDEVKNGEVEKDSIVIIGVSGYYPLADSVDEFGKNLQEGKDCITSIPKKRWEGFHFPYDVEQLYPYGGFIDAPGRFDPLFFRISPSLAENLDPQARLFMEAAWEACENAGFQISRNKHYYASSADNSVGVFAGVFWNHYELFASDMTQQGKPMSLGVAASAIPNMTSYCLNLHGPSMAVDTMCSSSLTALHLACDSIRNGECHYAIAGGVNVVTHPQKYLFLTQANFLSLEGRCKAFGQGADGYVPGEGVGALLLTTLSRAKKNGYPIYGIVKGSSLNHVGKTAGATVPEPVAQSEVIADALKKAGVDPRTITYVEAHGTGTSLGDPIEIKGLDMAYKKWTEDKQFCSIGSVKTNIGHLEAAAGVAGITKILLQFRYKKLFPSLHAKNENTFIDFSSTAFHVQKELSEWNAMEVKENGKTKVLPRRAAISAFGANGSNAHVILEEYIDENETQENWMENKAYPVMLSAITKERLQVYVQKIADFLNSIRESEISLQNLAFTLAVGRDAMDYRVVFCVKDIKELQEKMAAYLKGEGIGELYYENSDGVSPKENKNLTESTWSQWIQENNIAAMSKLWIQGYDVNWKSLFSIGSAKRIHIPTYPFERENYWVEPLEQFVSVQESIHPLLQKNISTIYEQKYMTKLTGKEFFLKSHVINGKQVLPGVAYLEMARAAMQDALGVETKENCGIKLQEVSWDRPLVIQDGENLQISVQTEGENLHYSIYVEDEDKNRTVYSQGYGQCIETDCRESKEHLRQFEEQADMLYEGRECYEYFKRFGFVYNEGLQGIKKIAVHGNKAVAEIVLPDGVEKEQYVLHPSMLDSAFQAIVAFFMDGSKKVAAMPFAIDELFVYGNCTSKLWAYVTKQEQMHGKNVQKYNLELCDEDGNCLVHVIGLSTRNMKDANSDNQETLIFGVNWKEQEVTESSSFKGNRVIVLYGQSRKWKEIIQREIDYAKVYGVGKDKEFDTGLLEDIEDVFDIVKDELRNSNHESMLIQVVVDENHVNNAVAGLLKTATIENPHCQCQVIQGADSAKELIDRLNLNSRQPKIQEIKYQGGNRFVKVWSEVAQKKISENIWKSNGVYVITGGMGGIGYLFAREIARSVERVHLLLIGRRALTADNEERMKKLESLGAKVEYISMDITDYEAVKKFVNGCMEKNLAINGILHCAGVKNDNFILKKDSQELRKVLDPKVKGTVNLDKATQQLSLDFFVMFSSLSGYFGNMGQADYAIANAFENEYATYREGLRREGKRKGVSVAIGWPLWQSGGMKVDEEVEKAMEEKSGIHKLDTESGLEAFYQIMCMDVQQAVVLKGNSKKIRERLAESEDSMADEVIKEQGTVEGELQVKMIQYLKELLSSVLKLSPDKIRKDMDLERYGLDSVMVLKLIGDLEHVFGPLSKTLFYEYQTIESLAGYFGTMYQEVLQKLFAKDTKSKSLPERKQANTEVNNTKLNSKTVRTLKNETLMNNAYESVGDIAIIGLSARYPKAKTKEEFWKNLAEGRDCIEEIPADRWDYRKYYSNDKEAEGKTYAKWGGFLDKFDYFEPLFFQISPKEATIMDPQERILLESVYQAIEDAGYTRKTLEDTDKGEKVGVFTGVMYEEYQLYGVEEQLMRTPVALSGSAASIANRISYWCNFHGPSMSVDTMCSSSLTALYLACEEIRQGKCTAAIAGGVNLSIHPNKFLSLGQGRFASSKGKCEAFGKGGDGYVPGEGVGAVVLKSLKDAEHDGDHIYGVIKGIALNHGGKTNGYTVPSPNAQAEVIREALVQANIDPRTISYIEAHGTGTSLGDPIEIAGLKKVFGMYTNEKQFCSIGSVKSNIGHCESAAGMASITKVLLQMEHKKIVPSLHSSVLNPHIDFEESPFYVQQELEEWKRPNVDGQEYPRRAGISCFGAGGTNAHMILEEYIPSETVNPENEDCYVILLSARTEETLKVKAEQLLKNIEEEKWCDSDLSNIVYTLQVGREELDCRVATVVKSIEELGEKLKVLVRGAIIGSEWHQGKVKEYQNKYQLMDDDEDFEEVVRIWWKKEKYEKILELWVNGLSVNWNGFYQNKKRKRISLPVYPFSGERYWYPGKGQKERIDNTDNVLTIDDSLLDSLFEQVKSNEISTFEAAQVIRNYL